MARKRALLVSASNYKDPSLRLGAGFIRGAQVLNEQLQRSGFETTVLEDNQATRTGILRALDDLRAAKPTDTVFLYFALHGQRLDSRPFELLPVEAEKHRPDQGVTALELGDRLAASPATNQYLLIDSCHAGGIVVARDSLMNMERASSFMVGACTKLQRLRLNAPDASGPMAALHARGLAGDAARDRSITAMDMVGFVFKNGNSQKEETPFLLAEGTKDFTLVQLPQVEPFERLYKLVLSMFGATQFQIFIARLPGGFEFTTTLPLLRSLSVQEFSKNILFGLHRARLLDGRFKEVLHQRRPARTVEIEKAMTNPERLRALLDLLPDMFSYNELNQLLGMQLGYSEVGRWAIEGDWIYQVLKQMRGKGMIDKVFFEQMSGYAPRRASEVLEVQEVW